MTEHVEAVCGREDSCRLVGMTIFHLSSITNHKCTLWPSPIPSSLLVLLLCSLYSDHVRPGPCHWPSKERLITGKERILFAFPFSTSLSFLARLPPSSSVNICWLSLSLSVYLTLSAFSLPCLYFLICRVRFENTLVRVLHPQIPACSLSGGY